MYITGNTTSTLQSQEVTFNDGCNPCHFCAKKQDTTTWHIELSLTRWPGILAVEQSVTWPAVTSRGLCSCPPEGKKSQHAAIVLTSFMATGHIQLVNKEI